MNTRRFTTKINEICSELKNLLDLESYAYADMILDIKIQECGKKAKQIVVELVDKRKICSSCLDETLITQSMKILEFYTKSIKLRSESVKR